MLTIQREEHNQYIKNHWVGRANKEGYIEYGQFPSSSRQLRGQPGCIVVATEDGGFEQLLSQPQEMTLEELDKLSKSLRDQDSCIVIEDDK